MSIVVSLLPLILLFVLMLGFKVSSHKSAFITLLVTVVLALTAAPAIGIIPDFLADVSIGGVVGFALIEGVLKAVFPILLIILMAIFSYNILLESRQIEVIKAQFISFTDEKGILVLMMVWGFGGLLEGMAGFGTAVAIPAAILIGLGFKPIFSALVALLGNTVCTGFGAVGVPVMTLCNEVSAGGVATHETVREISNFVVIELSPLFFLVPFAILMLTDRKPWARNLFLALWVGVVSVAVQYVAARWLGAETPAILGSIASIAAIALFAKLFGRKKQNDATAKPHHFTLCETFRAWSVYIFILLMILLSGSLVPPIEHFLKNHFVSRLTFPVIDSTFKFGWISNAALWLFVGTIAGGFVQGLSVRQMMRVLCRTIVNLRFTTITIISLISLASVMNYSGMISAIAVGLVSVTGSFYPLFAPLIGAVGTFVTGSDTSANILFAKLQAHVADQLGLTGQNACFGLGGSETNWLVAANTAGATGGKMISPQSIAIATAACNMTGKDDEILRKAMPYALAYIIVAGLMVYFGC